MAVAVFYFVFSIFLSSGTPNFVVFLICGHIPFLWFSKSVSNSSGAIIAGHGLINQVAIPKPFFPMLDVFQDALKQTVVFSLMLIFLVLYGMEVSWVWLSVAFVILTQFLLIIAISLLVAAITPFLPDFRFLVDTGMLALMFASGIFYSYKDVLLPQHQHLFLMNPIADLIRNYRLVLMENTPPDWSALAYICIGSITLIIVMTLYFRKTDTIYARLTIQ